MEEARRDRINELAATLAGILEDASVDAALLTRVANTDLNTTIDRFEVSLQQGMKLVARMRAAIDEAD